MRYGLPISIFFHAAIVAAVVIGWPVFSKPLAEKTLEVPVEIVRFDESTNPPPGKKEDQRDEREPDDEKTTGKARPVARPQTVPEPTPEREMKKPAEAPEQKVATPKTEPDTATPKTPEKPPEPPKTEVKKPAETPDPATPRTERDTATPARPTVPPQPKNVTMVPPKQVQKTPGESEPKKTDIKKPPAPPEPERQDVALKRPPRVTTPEPSAAPERPDSERDGALPKKPAAAPKPERQLAALRPPTAPEKTAPKEPKQDRPQVTSNPTFRPEPSEKKADAPTITTKPTYRAEKAQVDPRPNKAKQQAATPSPLDSVFKSLDRERKAPQQADADRTARDQRRGSPQHKPTAQLSLSEIDAIKRQIRPCWNADAAAKELESLVVSIEITMNEDGTVQDARVSPETRIRGPAHHAAAQRALRAVLNEKCQPFKLPPDKYARWKQMTLEFDPADN